MARSILDALGLFAAPFVAYAIFLVIRQRYPFVTESWSRGSLAWLTIAGLGLVALGMIMFGIFADRHRGAYVPAHIENGQLIPGRMQ